MRALCRLVEVRRKERDLAVANAAVIYLLEKIIAESPPGVKIVVFYDRAYFSLRKNLDLDFIKALASVLSDNYPERLGGATRHLSCLSCTAVAARRARLGDELRRGGLAGRGEAVGDEGEAEHAPRQQLQPEALQARHREPCGPTYGPHLCGPT